MIRSLSSIHGLFVFGLIVAIKGAEVLSASGLGPIPLMLSFTLLVGLINLCIGSASAQWKRIAHDCQREHQKALLEFKAEEDRKRRSLDRDPVDLLRRVIKLIPTLLRAAPDMAEELRKAIDAVVPRQ